MDSCRAVEADRGWWDRVDEGQDTTSPNWHRHRHLSARSDVLCLPAVRCDGKVDPLPAGLVNDATGPGLAFSREVADDCKRRFADLLPNLLARNARAVFISERTALAMMTICH